MHARFLGYPFFLNSQFQETESSIGAPFILILKYFKKYFPVRKMNAVYSPWQEPQEHSHLTDCAMEVECCAKQQVYDSPWPFKVLVLHSEGILGDMV